MSETLSTIGADRRQHRATGTRRAGTHTAPADVTTQGRRLLRRWPTILGTWLLVVALSVLAGSLWPPTYQATASVTVTPAAANPLTGEASEEEVDIHTEEVTMASERVALRAAADLQNVPVEEADAALARELLESTETAAPSQTQVVRVTVSSGDPNLAAERANALAAAYLADRAETVTAAAAEAIERLDKSIADLAKQDGQDSAVDQLREQRTSLALVSPTPGRIISAAAVPEQPSSAGFLLFTAGGITGGLVLGVLAGALRERSDKAVRRPERLAEATSTPVVVLRSEDDEDGALELLRLLAPEDEGRSVPRPGSRIAVYSTRPGHAPVVVGALRSVLGSWGGTVQVVDPEVLTSSVGPLAECPDWLALDEAPPTVLAAVVPSGASVAELAALADRVDGLVVAVEARSDVRRARNLVDRLTGRGAVVVPAFVAQRQARPEPAPAEEV